MKKNHVTWDLSPIYSSINDPDIAKDLAKLKKEAAAFEAKHSKNLSKYKHDEVLDFIKEYQKIYERLYVVSAYPDFAMSANSKDPDIIAVSQKVEVECSEIANHFVFIDLELAKNPLLEDFAKNEKLEPYNIIFTDILQSKRFQLSEPEEKIINIKNTVSFNAWVKLFENTFSRLEVEIGKKKVGFQSTIDNLHSTDRSLRKQSQQAVNKVLKQNSELLTYIYNMLLVDNTQMRKVRGLEYPEQSRHLSNNVTKKSIDVLTEITRKNFPLVARYYGLKKKLLKLRTMYDYDRYAPVEFKNLKEKDYPFELGSKMVHDALNEFDPEFARIFNDLIERRHVDAEVRPNKRGGAFCAYMPKQYGPFILMNYSNGSRDIETLAHEMGHAIHDVLSAKTVPSLVAHAPLTLAETASTFNEMIIFEKLSAQMQSRESKIVHLCKFIDGSIASIFRQISMFIFEQQVHNYVKQNGQIKAEQLDAFWIESQKPMFGQSVELTKEYSNWWSYVSHFMFAPFYVYSYAFGNLLVFALYDKYKKGEPGFVEKYKKFLAAGGSKTPQQAVDVFGFDLEDPKFWQGGFDMFADVIRQLEELMVK